LMAARALWFPVLFLGLGLALQGCDAIWGRMTGSNPFIIEEVRGACIQCCDNDEYDCKSSRLGKCACPGSDGQYSSGAVDLKPQRDEPRTAGKPKPAEAAQCKRFSARARANVRAPCGPTCGPTCGPVRAHARAPCGPTRGPTRGPTCGPTRGPTCGPTRGPTCGPTSSQHYRPLHKGPDVIYRAKNPSSLCRALLPWVARFAKMPKRVSYSFYFLIAPCS